MSFYIICLNMIPPVYRSLRETPHCLWVLWNAGTRPPASTSKATSKARISHDGELSGLGIWANDISIIFVVCCLMFCIDFDIALLPICMTEISTRCVFPTEVPSHHRYVVVPSSCFLRMAPEPKSSSEESESEAGCWVLRGRWSILDFSPFKPYEAAEWNMRREVYQ